ncbi:MAG: phenylalanine--tRNA ligase subunit beta, partial [Woeseiaceae bacterium]|nr:phenylalanine--tRNA ligase subunit beta [Woeseiaceae bacterium]
LAGIMGGMKSGVSENTSNILIESAYFTPTVIRKGAKTLDLSTESSKRFERDTDIDNMISAMDQLTQLIVDVAGGDVAKGIIDEYPTIKKLSKIKFSPSKCNKFLGTDLSNNDIEKIFEQLGITFSNKDEIYHCTIPSYRNDLDLILNTVS